MPAALEVVKDLEDVHVEQERLAAPRGHEERQAPEIVRLEGRDVAKVGLAGPGTVQLQQERLRVGGQAVEEDLRVQEGKVLEALEGPEWSGPPPPPPPGP